MRKFITIILVLMLGVFFVWITNKKIGLVEIIGTEKISKKQILNQISEEATNDFYSINLYKIKKQLEDLEWINKANVSKLWPSTLKIDVKEEYPVAFLAKDKFLLASGSIIPKNDSVSDLPILYASEANYTAMKLFFALDELSELAGLTLQSIVVHSPSFIEVTFKSGLVLKFDQKNALKDLARFINSFNKVVPQDIGIHGFKVIDFRYNTGITVTKK